MLKGPGDLLLAMFCLSEQRILGKLSVRHFDILSSVSKTDVTVPLTSNKRTVLRALSIRVQDYNP